MESMLVVLLAVVGMAMAADAQLPQPPQPPPLPPPPPMPPTPPLLQQQAPPKLNILMILADDLGYGDTSVAPFVGTGIKTPHLEEMARRGLVMSNFHSAAATCSPTRASILTGLYPWRVGMKAVFEYGEKGKSNRDDWLPQLPTSAMVFRDKGYFTGHSGKWHLAGMRNDDHNMRMLPAYRDPATGGMGNGSVAGMRRCPHPGPNQQGFEEYGTYASPAALPPPFAPCWVYFITLRPL